MNTIDYINVHPKADE